MKHLSLFIIFIFFTTFLQAEYLRSIRVGSFKTMNDAQSALGKLKSFASSHENLVSLQDEWEFKYKARKSGKYYITLIEPFTNRQVLQESLDTLRLEYKDVYVTRLKSIFKDKAKIIPKTESFKVEKIEEKEYITKEIQEIQRMIEKDVEVFENAVAKPVQVKISKPISELPIESNSFLYKLLFLLSLVVIGILLGVVFLLKREKEEYSNTHIITNAKLDQLNTQMQEKEKFLAHTSHELRTPMTSIIGLTHLVLESKLSSVQKDYIQIIQSSSENLLNIINDILDISKINAGELQIEKAEFNINDILEYVLNTISIQAKNNHINISMNIQNDVPSRIVGDSLRLGQVLINLLSNSVKFTKDGDVTLNVQKIATYGDSLTLEFSVSDTGIGMSEIQVEHIFEVYSQADKTISRKFGGTGLGLAISKQLVEMMNGKINVRSEKGVGTTFTFSITFKIKDSDNKRQYRLPSSTLLNKRVLIVESSNKSVISLIRTLGYFNYKTHSIPSFEEAVLEENIEFDIVIINQVKLTKFAINKLKEMQNIKRYKIVVLSELYSGISSNSLKELKIDAYLKTPFTQQNILNMIVELYVTKKTSSSNKKGTNKDKLKNIGAKKILVAEDNEVNHKVIKGLLADTKIELTFVTDGYQVLEKLKEKQNFNLILMDINMPKLDGYQTTLEIRKNESYNKIPILALTADVTDDAIAKSFSLGMQGHIAKPIIIDLFYKKIYDILKKPIIENSLSSPKKILNKSNNELEELSASIGLKRCNDDKDFYKSILKDFKVRYANSASTIEQLCLDSDFKQARKLAVDIKDISLSIGAYNLCESASMMEYEFEKGSRSNWKKLIGFYSISLNKLFKDLDNYLKQD